jgi:ferrous iron transport protein A
MRKLFGQEGGKVMAPLGLLSIGERGEILSIRGERSAPEAGKNRLLCHVEEIGLRVGKVVEMMNNEGKGSLLVKVDESRIALGRGMAMKIMVRRIVE